MEEELIGIFPWYPGIPQVSRTRFGKQVENMPASQFPSRWRSCVLWHQAKMVGRKKVGFIPVQSTYRMVTEGCGCCGLVLFLVCMSRIYYCKQLLWRFYFFIFDFNLGDMINLGWLNIGKPENCQLSTCSLNSSDYFKENDFAESWHRLRSPQFNMRFLSLQINRFNTWCSKHWSCDTEL